jgi:hypothetical protein
MLQSVHRHEDWKERVIPVHLNSRSFRILAALMFFAIPAFQPGRAGATQQAAPTHPSTARGENAPIACRVMERHMDKERGIVLILFHQRDKPDQPKLKDFLLQHDGGTIEIQTGSADWQKVTVWRIRNCFGRGLFVVPNDAAPKEKAIFKIRPAQ